jgi:hypothetical protein
LLSFPFISREQLALCFWELSLFARDAHGPAGSEVLGEGRESGNVVETILNHLSPRGLVGLSCNRKLQNNRKT